MWKTMPGGKNVGSLTSEPEIKQQIWLCCVEFIASDIFDAMLLGASKYRSWV
jgi:hypothetical protein